MPYYNAKVFTSVSIIINNTLYWVIIGEFDEPLSKQPFSY